MTQNTPGLSRRRGREHRAAPARVAPEVRPIEGGDLFAWIELYAAYLEQMGVAYTDEAALRTWRELGLGGEGEAPTPGLQAIIAERSGNLVGFAISQPVMSPLDGLRRLEVPALYVERLDHDGFAFEALLEALHQRAAEVGAARVRWSMPEDAAEMRRRLERLGSTTTESVTEMPVLS